MNRIIERFLRYISIESESGNEKKMAEQLLSELTALGYKAKLQNTDSLHTNAGNIYLYVPGELPGEPVLLTSHMDTVKPGNNIRPIFDGEYIYSDGTTVLGGDDKSGISVIMETLQQIQEQKLAHRPFEIIFSFGEETGLLGAKEAVKNEIRSKWVLVLDSFGPAGKIIRHCTGQSTLHAVFHGKAAHAGNDISSGISAIQMAAEAITHIPLMQVDEETTANIGTIRAEGVTSIVAPECEVILEARSGNIEKLSALKKKISKEVEETVDRYGGTVSQHWEDDFSSFDVPEDHELFVTLQKSYLAVGISPFTQYSGGGSDANVYNSAGFTALNLGDGSERIHTKQERLHIPDMIDLQQVILHFLTTGNAKP